MMATSGVNFLKTFSIFPIIKDRLLSSKIQRRILQIALLIIGCLSACYLAYQFCNASQMKRKKVKIFQDAGNNLVARYADTLHLQGKLGEAKLKFQEALEIDPKNSFTLARYAEILRMEGKLGEAELKFQEALETDPKNSFILSGYAETLRMQGKLEEAAIQYRKALAIDPKNVFILSGLEILRLLGKVEEAKIHF
jgi:tetratricopeptide (TPR) repeat protein